MKNWIHPTCTSLPSLNFEPFLSFPPFPSPSTVQRFETRREREVPCMQQNHKPTVPFPLALPVYEQSNESGHRRYGPGPRPIPVGTSTPTTSERTWDAYGRRTSSPQPSSAFQAKLRRMQQLFDELLLDIRADNGGSADVTLDLLQSELRRQEVALAQFRAINGIDNSGGFPPSRSPVAANTPRRSPRDLSSTSDPNIPWKQNSSPCWITVWLGTHRAGQPRRILLPRHFTWTDVMTRCADELQAIPAPSLLYTPDGRTVSSLDDITPGVDYLILPQGARYREDSVPTLLLEKIINRSPSTFVGERNDSWTDRPRSRGSTYR